MPEYRYECKAHGQFDLRLPMPGKGERHDPQYCVLCLAVGVVAQAPMRRIFTPLGKIIRPSGWLKRPGDEGYANFNRELELGEVRGPSHERTPVVADEPQKPVEVVVPEQRLQEIHELGRVVDRQIREEMALPSAVLDLV